MSAPTVSAPQTTARPASRRRLGDRLLWIYVWLILAWLFLPIAVMIVFGFNDTQSKSNVTWQGFTLKWWGRLDEHPQLTEAVINSLQVAVVSTLIVTVIGTLLGLALGRYKFRGQGATNLVLFAAIASPELVMGASLLSLFISVAVQTGFVTVVIAHVLFSLSFVAITVRARVVGLDPSIEEAARDLGASTWVTFWRVTFPMILPGVVSGALLAFALSIDDFVITEFTSGAVHTFPLWIMGATRNGVPPQVNIIGTLIFAVGVAIAVFNAVSSRRRT
ncbi:spermidine/putrescine transport system permease protein [Streptosporangium becharense]|uniref:Spermidine/putrescine transport system permease protein n=1 Tax=Streptosporangium becharense TaxID=1816182 RepID=A0A7W9IDY0_9ACTN|nr:ABC transporter permease [Streptosporangium becharense]MBB2910083.1 spermidine/putrescine transport system permease protein [Streptosporangium becharense]MBB5818962.1 spermidine/putrescine transport system permease protein [Streptosporangium becharense]